MGFLCNIRNDKVKVSQSDLDNQELLRNVGLSNIFNINTTIDVCVEEFKSPQYYVSGATKLFSLIESSSACTTSFTNYNKSYPVCQSGYTLSAGTNICYQVSGATTATTSANTYTINQTLATYNLDYTPNFNISFILTGMTDYTGYTGSFCYKIFGKNNFRVSQPVAGLPPTSELVNNCIEYNQITGGSVTYQFLSGNTSKTWNEYLIRPYYTFTSKTCNKGQNFNTWDSEVQLNQFNPNTDFYFSTVINPPVPELNPPQGQAAEDVYFVQDILLNKGVVGETGPQAINDELNYFLLGEPPLGTNVMIFVNGVKMTENYDYTLLYYNGALAPPAVVFQGMALKSTDVVVANYLVGTNESFITTSNWFINNLQVSTITTNTNPGYNVAINYNSVTGKQEMFLNKPISQTNAVVLFVNGVQMLEGVQFFKSTTENNKLIFNDSTMGTIVIGDIVSVFAVSTGNITGGYNYGSLDTNSFTANWTVPTALPENVSNDFVLQVANYNDTGYTIVLYQSIAIPFFSSQGNYTATINSLTLNQRYRFRVLSRATYTDLANNKIKTCSYSEGFFDTTSQKLNNSY